jgi:hypothetical protein
VPSPEWKGEGQGSGEEPADAEPVAGSAAGGEFAGLDPVVDHTDVAAESPGGVSDADFSVGVGRRGGDAVLTGHTDGVQSLAVAPDGFWLASAGEDEEVRIWDPATGTVVHILSGGPTSGSAALS